jgi:transcriptional regulator with XRE-family HTH domain
MLLAKEVWKLRRESGLSLEAFGSLCGWGHSYQSLLESGKVNPTVKTLNRIANATNTKLSITFD